MKTAALSLVVLAIGFVCACQNASIVEYEKYNDERAVPRVSAVDAKAEFDAGNVVFVDSRGEAAWKAERLPGAFSIPVGSTEDKFSVLPKGKKIIVYCS